VQIGALAGGADETQLQGFTKYGQAVGLAFQIADDLLDVTASTAQLGKTAGHDVTQGKATYPALFGIKKSRALAKEAADRAVAALAVCDDRAEPLRALAYYIVSRTN
jgi:geranylgeranyl diphosphate synthase type II